LGGLLARLDQQAFPIITECLHLFGANRQPPPFSLSEEARNVCPRCAWGFGVDTRDSTDASLALRAIDVLPPGSTAGIQR